MISMPNQIAAVGDADSVLGFAALGIEAVAVGDAEKAEHEMFRLAKAGTAVIFITEEIAAQIQPLLDRYATQPYPAIIPIPSNQGGTGLGMQQLKRNVEKALGADILFGKESGN